MERVLTGIRGITKVVFYTTLAPVNALIALGSIVFWWPSSLARRREFAPPVDGNRQVLVVTPFAPGEESGGAKAVQDLLQMLEPRWSPKLALVRKASVKGTMMERIARLVLKPVPVPDECRALLVGSAEIRLRIRQSSILLFEFMATGFYLLSGGAHGRRVVLRDHEVLVRKLSTDLQRKQGLDLVLTFLRLVSTYAISAAIYARADLIITLTAQDCRAVQAWFPLIRRRVIWVPTAFQAPEIKSPMPLTAASCDLVMVANFFHSPNVDGLRWFLDECGHHLGPGYTLHLCGLDSPLDSIPLDQSNLRVVRHGFVRDPTLIASTARIAVAPIVSGGGVRIKNLFLGSLGLALVTTPLGNEGIEFEHGRHALICSDAATMADAIRGLAGNPGEVSRIGQEAREFIRREFHPSRIEQRLLAAISGETTQQHWKST